MNESQSIYQLQSDAHYMAACWLCLSVHGILLLATADCLHPEWCREQKYLTDQHSHHAPTEGNRTTSRSYLAPSAKSFRRTAQVLAGTWTDKAHIVARMEVFSRPEGPVLEALEEEWIDQHLCPGLVTVHKAILEAQRSAAVVSKLKAQDLSELQLCSEADIYLHRSFLRALPLWLDRQGAGYPLYDLLEPIREHPGWPAYRERLLWCSRSQEQERQGGTPHEAEGAAPHAFDAPAA